MAIVVELDVLLTRRNLSVGAFADAVGITPAPRWVPDEDAADGRS